MVITTNKVVVISNFSIIEKYIKNVDDIDINKVISSKLPQSKSYLKILDITYHIKDINLPITPDIVERIIYTTYIFNNTILVSCSRIIKASSKLDMVVIWIDIWDS